MLLAVICIKGIYSRYQTNIPNVMFLSVAYRNDLVHCNSPIQTKKIESLDLKVFDTKIKMQNKIAEEALAAFILKQVKQ